MTQSIFLRLFLGLLHLYKEIAVEEAADGNLGVGATMYVNGLVTPSTDLTSWHKIEISGGRYHMLVHILP